MNRITALLLATLLLAGCNTFYPGEPGGPRPRFNAALTGENEVPPTPSEARGSMVADYLPATKILHWQLTLRGLSSPVTWAFLCGPDGVGNDNAELYVFRHDKKPEVIDDLDPNATSLKTARQFTRDKQAEIGKKYLIDKVTFDTNVRSTPIVANGVLYVMTEKTLYAIGKR